MAFANFPVEEQQYTEILDEEFQRYLDVTKTLVETLKRPSDKEICGKFIRKCVAMDAQNIEVKTNRNEFFKYFLKTLQTASENQPPQYDTWFKPKARKKSGETTSFWSEDKKTYVAAKTIPGYGTLVYMAVSYKPHIGWQKCGFSSYEF